MIILYHQVKMLQEITINMSVNFGSYQMKESAEKIIGFFIAKVVAIENGGVILKML